MSKAIFYFNSRKSKWHIFYKSVICFTNTSERVYWMKGRETSLDNKIIWWISWAKLKNEKDGLLWKLKMVQACNRKAKIFYICEYIINIHIYNPIQRFIFLCWS